MLVKRVGEATFDAIKVSQLPRSAVLRTHELCPQQTIIASPGSVRRIIRLLARVALAWR